MSKIAAALAEPDSAKSTWPFSVFSTDLGWMGIRWQALGTTTRGSNSGEHPSDSLSDRGSKWSVRRLTFGHGSRVEALDHLQAAGRRQVSQDSEQRSTIETIIAYAAGEPLNLGTIPVVTGDRTLFQQSVLNACRTVPWGQTRSYAELAKLAGHSGSARAVGNVMANNRAPLLIPCHRIVPSGTAGRRKLGGFTAPGGVDMKRRLLELEEGSLWSRV